MTDEIVMHRRTGLLDPAALLAEHAPSAVVPADPPRGPVSHAGPHAAGFVGQETLAELRIPTGASNNAFARASASNPAPVTGLSSQRQ
ncbi:hypothetical protein OG698_01545 [Streptomyces sp. NBC_01003]|uniref:hypothetical protein n=1 Tax=Streptomyces sp. NBC_01003 TaxID=2903714 RepID=UPI00386A4229|nr:hypothetical protein OG698_01545 [Streptomyces sp. NBC_01003]